MNHFYSDACACDKCNETWRKVFEDNLFDLRLMCPCGGEMYPFGAGRKQAYSCRKCKRKVYFPHMLISYDVPLEKIPSLVREAGYIWI